MQSNPYMITYILIKITKNDKTNENEVPINVKKFLLNGPLRALTSEAFRKVKIASSVRTSSKLFC